MAKKSRYPSQFGWQDFLTFMRDLLYWLAGQVGKPDYVASLVAGLSVKVDDFEAALVTYINEKDLAPDQRKAVVLKTTALYDKLAAVKIAIPVFFPDPATLGEFTLAGPIPQDEDDLYIVASACLLHWEDVKLLPAYAPLVADFAELKTVFDEFVLARTTYHETFQDMETSQGDMGNLKISILEQERKLFNWYRSKHKDSEEIWWTDTPWGASYGGEPVPGEPGEPVGAFPAKVSNMKVEKASPPQNGAIISCDPLAGVIGYNVCKAKVPTGMPRPTRPAEKWVFIEEPPVIDTGVEIGFDYYYWICGVDENNVEGAWSDAMMEWVG